ncbi:NAD(P)/FAD-dependent oxidoreductase [Cohnella herbarum]|uniref:Ferredoxin--NADP reductase n=1 Tax=Cohnella herbarum TaxID=2728023 RepID=A0A7Z2VFH8_9BACL|nr:NAD(P)/FAD-dependent oxidoreductase [Cohnella herbarum]QJD82119.1 NAD(P)/FAD-dependent oxidoreductase [Cohnella herbarum]
MNGESELYDLTIIGGGPAGLYAAFYGGMRDMKTKLIEAREELGGRTVMYPNKIVWDIGGVPPTRCGQITSRMIEQAMTFEPTIVLGQQIAGLERLIDGTMVVTSDRGERHHTRSLILAVGHGALKQAKLAIEGAERFEAANLHYSVTDLEVYRGKRILISGGGDSAVDWANELERVAASVALVHRRNRFTGHELNVKRMKESSVEVRTPYAIKELHGDGDRIEEVSIARLDSEGQPSEPPERLAVDAVIVNHGLRGDFGRIVDWGLEMGDWNIRADAKLATNIPGVFVAGDTADHPGKLHLIAGAFADAALAVNGAKRYLDPEAPRAASVSSHNAKFDEKNSALSR